MNTTEGFEVDFYACYPAGGQELVQVCADPSPPIVKDRELRALAQASREYRRATCRLLVLTGDQIMFTAPPGVDIRPAYEWLLAEPGEA